MLTYFLKTKSTDLTTLSFGSRTFTRRGIIILSVVLVHKGRLFCFTKFMVVQTKNVNYT